MGNQLKNNFLLTASTSLFLLLLVVQSSFGQGQRQFVSFYRGFGCKTNLKTIYSDDYDIRLNVSSVKVNGMWLLSSCSGNLCNNITTTTYIGEGGCVPNTNNNTYLQAIRYGDDLQRNASIAFYPSDNFTGSPVIVGTKGLNYSHVLYAGSWFFTGSHNWAVYEFANFTGKKICLTPSSKIKSRGYGISYSTTQYFLYTSVQYGGCESGVAGLKGGYLMLVLLSLFKLMF